MLIIPIAWSFRRKTFLPILEAEGIAPVQTGAQEVLMVNATELIEKCEEYKGRLMPLTDGNHPNGHVDSITISFTVIFPGEAEIGQFQKFLDSTK